MKALKLQDARLAVRTMTLTMHYSEPKDRSSLLQSLTGFNLTEFEALLPSFAAAWDTFTEETFEHRKRKRARGGGQKLTQEGG